MEARAQFNTLQGIYYIITGLWDGWNCSPKEVAKNKIKKKRRSTQTQKYREIALLLFLLISMRVGRTCPVAQMGIIIVMTPRHRDRGVEEERKEAISGIGKKTILLLEILVVIFGVVGNRGQGRSLHRLAVVALYWMDGCKGEVYSQAVIIIIIIKVENLLYEFNGSVCWQFEENFAWQAHAY